MTDIHLKGHFYIITALQSNYRASECSGYKSDGAFRYNHSTSIELQGVRMWRIRIQHAPSTQVQDRITNRQYLQGAGERGKASTNYQGPTGGRGGRGPDYVVYVFTSHDNIIICRLYKLTFSDQAQVTLQLRVGLSDLVLRFSACSPSMQGSKKFFYPGPKSALGGLANRQAKLQEKLLTLSFMFMTPCTLQVGTSVPEKQTAAFFVHRSENFESSENVSLI